MIETVHFPRFFVFGRGDRPLGVACRKKYFAFYAAPGKGVFKNERKFAKTFVRIMKIALIGYGKMGKEIEQILISRGHTVTLIIDIDNAGDLNAENLRKADVAIEFTTPHTAFQNIVTCLEAGVPVVCGTTGWLDRYAEVEKLCNERKGTFFYASNYSVGVNVFFAVNRRLAELMERFPEYDVTVEPITRRKRMLRAERRSRWPKEFSGT